MARRGRTFRSPNGVPILVGRNRAQNEELSLRIAREPDVWMHVRGAPGAHVVLRYSEAPPGHAPSDECLQRAADLAAYFSELRGERRARVTFTSPKHVTKPRGAPLGAVLLRKEQTLHGVPGRALDDDVT